MKKIILIIVAIVLIGGAFYVYRNFQTAQEVGTLVSDIETVVIEEGSLVTTIDAIGKVRSKQATTLRWETSGAVEQVNIAVGDHVQAGDMLASLSQTSLPQNVIMAQADLVNAQTALEDLYTNSESARTKAMKDIATYAQAVRDAQYQLDNYTIPSDQAEYSAMEALDLMEARLDQARQAFEPYKYYSSSNTTREELKEALDQAQSDYNAAVKRLDYEYELQVAKDNLDTARRDYQKWENGPSRDDIAAAEARIAAAQATLSQAWIKAPFDGTVTMAAPLLGDQVSPNVDAFRIDDLSTLFVDLSISEIDINQVKVGQEVALTFDAIRGKEYHGQVTEIAAIGAETQGVVNFTVTAQMSDPDEDVRSGMTSSVEIVIARHDKALLVPNQALRYEGGVQVVYVPNPGEGDAYIPVGLRLGNSSETYSEVLDGELEAGDQVVINPLALVEGPENSFGVMMGGPPDDEQHRPFGGNGGQP